MVLTDALAGDLVMQKWTRWQDWTNVVLGVLLFITPFVFGATPITAAAYTAYIGGVLLVIAGLFDLATPKNQAGEWAEALLGVLVFISPWVLGFSGLTPMAWSAWIIGVLSVVLAASVLFAERNHQTMAAQH
jgi:uncharacterized membrane protein HdeD (DUF308 family)